MFSIFLVLKSMLHRCGGDLSGGQQQRLVIGPKLLIFDDWTDGIQPNLVHEIGNFIPSLKRELGVIVLLVE